LTCKNIFAARKLAQPEINSLKQLNWAHENPVKMQTLTSMKVLIWLVIIGVTGDFHFLWECLRFIYMSYWGRASQPGSLCHLREVVRRVQVNKAVKVFSTGDEFVLHCFQSHLLASICKQLLINDPPDKIPHGTPKNFFETPTLSSYASSLSALTNGFMLPSNIIY